MKLTEKQIKQVEELMNMKYYARNVFIKPKSKNCDYALYFGFNSYYCIENVENGNIRELKLNIHLFNHLRDIYGEE